MTIKTRHEEKLDEIRELLDSFQKNTKTETLCYQIGFLSSWLGRLASQDSLVQQELNARLKLARRKKK